MRRISHHLLGKYIIKHNLDQISEIERRAFLFGCTEPDINYATYLKGTFTAKAFHGHNFENCKGCISRLIGKLSEGDEGILFYYRLGKLTHYILDSFTWPHNEDFTGSISEHVEYEHKLHPLFCSYLAYRHNISETYTGYENLYTWFIEKHNLYLEERRGMEDDCSYALYAAVSAVNFLYNYQKDRQLFFSGMPAFF